MEKSHKIKDYHYIIEICLFLFIFNVIIFILGWSTLEDIVIYQVCYLYLFLITLGILIFTIFTGKNRSKLDFIIVIILFLAATSIFIQSLIYLYYPESQYIYYSLHYRFPGILRINECVLDSSDSLLYETTIGELFDPNLIVSCICLVIAIITNIINWQKNIRIKQYKIIKDKVKSQLKTIGVKDKNKINEVSQRCLIEYKLAIENGNSEEESLQQSFSYLDKTLDNYKSSKNRNYALKVSLIGFISSLIVSTIGMMGDDVLFVLTDVYIILFIVFLGILIFTICTCKRRSKLDFIIVIILFLAALSVFIECIEYFYRGSWGYLSYYTLNYIFPGILRFNSYHLTSYDPEIIYEFGYTIILFDITLIVSFICLIAVTILILVERKINHEEKFRH